MARQGVVAVCSCRGQLHTPVTRTDGFPAYPEAVDLAFGPYAKYGVIVLIWMIAR